MDVVSTTEFPVTRCAECARDVLCCVELDARDEERIRCVECAAEIDPAAVRWLAFEELERAGYGFAIPEGGCGRPDCGQGRCGRSAPGDHA
jgi:hypothetical protein